MCCHDVYVGGGKICFCGKAGYWCDRHGPFESPLGDCAFGGAGCVVDTSAADNGAEDVECVLSGSFDGIAVFPFVI
ncbi:Uncharacterised protein [Mycobacteroides abscessus subsp. abscessus]|nr:Uncharacterised protein [Mycobacteroides abscessus subsp. abscessus]